MRPRSLSAEREEEVAEKFELHLKFAPKRLCQQYGISRTTLSLILDRVRARRTVAPTVESEKSSR